MLAAKYGFGCRAFAVTQGPGLSNPALQPMFTESVPNALDPGFIYDTSKGKIKVALFEGTDEFGRLQPLLGTAELAMDYLENPVNWPNTPAYVDAGLVGQMEGSIAWHSPTSENPALGSTEEWEIWNVTGDAHPVQPHLVHFEIMNLTTYGVPVLQVGPEA